MEHEKYYSPDHNPNSQTYHESYAMALEEFLIPAPAAHVAGMKMFDKVTGGFRPKEFTILCGSTGVGKTCLLANWSAEFLKANIKHFVVSVETGHTDFVKRIISAIQGEDWNTGMPVALEKIKAFALKSGDLFEKNYSQLSLYENRFKIETLMADIQWHVDNNGIQVCLIDNINFFMEVTSAQNSIIAMDSAIHALIIFCKRVNVHLVMVMHPKKTENGRVESEFDIKGSSTAVQEAHNIFILNRAGKDLITGGDAVDGDRELKIAKMRRIGRAVGSRIIYGCTAGVSYYEKAMVK